LSTAIQSFHAGAGVEFGAMESSVYLAVAGWLWPKKMGSDDAAARNGDAVRESRAFVRVLEMMASALDSTRDVVSPSGARMRARRILTRKRAMNVALRCNWGPRMRGDDIRIARRSRQAMPTAASRPPDPTRRRSSLPTFGMSAVRNAILPSRGASTALQGCNAYELPFAIYLSKPGDNCGRTSGFVARGFERSMLPRSGVAICANEQRSGSGDLWNR
jgi:hypothetical protein